MAAIDEPPADTYSVKARLNAEFVAGSKDLLIQRDGVFCVDMHMRTCRHAPVIDGKLTP